MDYREYQAEDLLLDASFRDYCLGKDEKAVSLWEDWLAANPDRLHAVREAKQLYSLLNGQHSAITFLPDEKAFRLRFAGHLGEELRPESAPKRKWYYAGAIAVSLAAVLLFILLPRQIHTPPSPISRNAPTEYVKTSKAGERKSFQLPDGSKVMLNAGSTLHIPAGFNRSGREVTLEGEAFFDVARDVRKPFVIHTSAMDIKVLGTTFNIKAYSGDAQTEASLLAGSVEVLVKDGQDKKFILRPSEKIIVPNRLKTMPSNDSSRAGISRRGSGRYKIRRLSFNKADSSLVEISWTESRLAFNDDSFEEIARQLERWYDVSIRFEDESVSKFRFTATFDKKTIEQVLNALQLSRSFTYRQEEGNQIVIGGSGQGH